MATVIDVARRAGVSLATASRALNGLATVAPEMRDKVAEAALALGYRPNPMAQGLRKGQSNTVALLVGDIAQRHFAELTMHVQAALQESGADLLLYNLSHSESRLEDFLRRAPSMRLRAVALALSDTVSRSVAPLISNLRQHGILVVSIGQNLSRLGIASIVHEERAAAHRAVRWMLDRGRRRIAYIGRIERSAVGSERYRGYQAALQRAGVFDPALVFDLGFRYQAGRDAVLRALDQGLAFDGVQAGSDEIATGAMAALADRGRRVPQDVAVIGFGGVEMGAYLRPALTTLSTHPDLAAARLRDLLKGDAAAAETAAVTLLRRELVLRDSA